MRKNEMEANICGYTCVANKSSDNKRYVAFGRKITEEKVFIAYDKDIEVAMIKLSEQIIEKSEKKDKGDFK